MDSTLEITTTTDTEILMKSLVNLVNNQKKYVMWKVIWFLLLEMSHWFILVLIWINISIMTEDCPLIMFWHAWTPGGNEFYAQKNFPKIIDCIYQTPRGSQYDAVCTMSLNYDTELLFMIFLLWTFLLLVAGLINIIFRLFTLHPTVLSFSLLWTTFDKETTKKISTLTNYFPWGQTYLLLMIGHNLTANTFEDLVMILAEMVNPGVEDTETNEKSESEVTSQM